MDWNGLFETSDIRILAYLNAKSEARYSDLEKNVVRTRSVLSVSLQDLTARGLIDRMVEPSKPIQTKYKLSDKGKKIVQHLVEIRKLIG